MDILFKFFSRSTVHSLFNMQEGDTVPFGVLVVDCLETVYQYKNHTNVINLNAFTLQPYNLEFGLAPTSPRY